MLQHESDDDEMREEYDFSGSVRAPYAERAGDVHIVSLDEDVYKAFPDSQAVNEALRLLLKAARSSQALSAQTVAEKAAAEVKKAR